MNSNRHSQTIMLDEGGSHWDCDRDVAYLSQTVEVSIDEEAAIDLCLRTPIKADLYPPDGRRRLAILTSEILKG